MRLPIFLHFMLVTVYLMSPPLKCPYPALDFSPFQVIQHIAIHFFPFGLFPCIRASITVLKHFIY